MPKKADTLPSPVEVLETQTKADEAELTKLREESEKPPEAEELAEESLSSEDNEEKEPEVDEPKEKEPVVEEQEPELSKRGQERFRKLSEERRQALADLEAVRKEKENLLSIVQALQEQGYSQKQAQDIAPQIEQGYIDPRQYQQDVARQAQSIVSQTLTQREQQQAIIQSAERFQEDLKVIEEKHPELNEDHPDYDEDLSNFVSELYQSKFEKNPKVRLPDIVNQVMKLRGKAAEVAEKKQASKVARQVSKQAMTSSGGKTDTSSLAQKLSEADSEAELAELRKLLPQE